MSDSARCRKCEGLLSPDGSCPGCMMATAGLENGQAEAERIFQAALSWPVGEREAFVVDACDGQEALEAEVRMLLDAFQEEGGDDATPTVAGHATSARATWAQPRDEVAGTVIGHFELVKVIGQGGMGIVWEARQTAPVVRLVALKVIKLGMDTREVVARFERERQTLALMSHPHIAQIFEAGSTETGRPYFVMELVNGRPISRYCDEETLGIRERLTLFLELCSAIEHAHQKGVIHRDLKPSNILVSYDGSPKVIDFGVAKATRETGDAQNTRLAQVLGTPAYMSPEQASGDGTDIDTRTDVYSLGVVLYELLSGVLPIEARRLSGSSVAEMNRILREEEPRRPSTQRGAGRGPAADRQWQRAVRGDLDWITLKCLEKDRTARYASARALADDVQAWMDNRPVTAAPQRAAYYVRKWVTRHRVAFAAALCVFLSLVLGTIVALAQAQRANASARQAAAARTEAERLLRVSQHEEGKALLERARALAETRNLFAAKLTAGRALGFAGFGREEAGPAFQAQYPVLLFPDSEETGAVQRILNTPGDYSMIWQSPSSAHHDGPVTAVALHPDGSLVASCGPGESVIRFHATTTGALLRELPALTPQPAALHISPDGKWLAAGGESREVQVWEVDGAWHLRTLTAGSRQIRKIRFSPDGTLLCAAGSSGPVTLWDTATWEALPPPGVDGPAVLDFSFSADGTLLAVLNSDAVIRTWQPRTQTAVHTLRLPAKDSPKVIALTPDGLRIYAGFSTGRTLGFTLADGKPLADSPAEHRLPVSALAISADGKAIATGSWDGSLRLADRETGREAHPLAGHSHRVLDMTFSADGRLLATGSEDNTVRLWKCEDGSALFPVTGHTAPVRAVAFSPDGRCLASTGDDQTLQLWDLATRSSRMILTKDSAGIHALDFSPSGSLVVAAGGFGTVKFWNTADGLRSQDLRMRHPSGVNAVRFLNEGSVITGGIDGSVRTWDTASGRELSRVTAHEGVVSCLDLRPGGGGYATGGSDRIVRLWQPPDTRPVREFHGHTSMVTSVRFSPDGRTLTSADRSGTLRFWDLGTGLLTNSVINSVLPVSALDYRPDGARLAAGSTDGTVRIWNVRTWKPEAVLEGHRRAVTDVHYSPDGSSLATAGTDRSVALWQTTGAETLATQAHTGPVRALLWEDGLLMTSGADDKVRTWDPDTLLKKDAGVDPQASADCLAANADWLITGGQSGLLHIWNRKHSAAPHIFQAHRNRLDAAVFTPDGSRLCTASMDGKLRIWQTGTWRLLTEITLREPGVRFLPVPWSLCISQDGSRLYVAGDSDGRIRNWHLPDGQELPVLDAHTGAVRSLHFHPSRDLLAAGSADGTISLWSGGINTPVTVLHPDRGAVFHVSFDPSGNFLASAGEDQTIVIWDLASRQQADILEGHTGTVQVLRFDPAGSRLASGGEDGQLKIWDLNRRHPASYAASFLHYETGAHHLVTRPRAVATGLATPQEPPALFVPPGSTLTLLQGPEDGVASRLFHRCLQARNWKGAARQLARIPEGSPDRQALADTFSTVCLTDDLTNPLLLDLAESVCGLTPRVRTARAVHALRTDSPGVALAEISALLVSGDTVDKSALLHARFRHSLTQADPDTARPDLQTLLPLAATVGERERLYHEFATAWHDVLSRTTMNGAAPGLRSLGGLALIEHGLRAAAIAPGDEQFLLQIVREIVDIQAAGSPPLPLIPDGAIWQYLDDASDPGQAWKSSGPVPAEWRTGAAPLGASQTWKRTDIRRNLSGDTAQPSTMSFYFRHVFPRPDLGMRSNLLVTSQYDDGLILYLNGRELRRINMAAGPVTPLTAASDYQNKPGSTSFLIPASLLGAENLLAAEVHQREPSSSDIYFDATVTAVASTAENWLATLDPVTVTDGLAWCEEFLPPALVTEWLPQLRFAFAAEATAPPPDMDPALAWLMRARIQKDREHEDASTAAAAKGLKLLADTSSLTALQRDIRRHLIELASW